AIGHVADGIDVLGAGPRKAVDLDLAALAELDAGLLDMQHLGVGGAADRQHDLVGLDDVALVGLGVKRVAALLDLGELATERDVHAAPFHRIVNTVADIVVEAAQDLFAAINERDVRAQAVEDVREFECDVAAAGDQNALRQLFEMKRFVRGDAEIAARNDVAGPELARRTVAGRDQDLFRRDRAILVEQTQRVRILEHGAIGEDIDAGRLDVSRIDGFKPRDFLVLVRDQGRPVELRFAHRPAEPDRIGKVVGEMAGINEDLFRNAAADDTGSAHARFLGERHARTGESRHAAGAHAARAAADDEKIVVVPSHAFSLALANRRLAEV